MIMDQEAMREYPSLLSSTSHSFCSGVIAGVDYSANDHVEKKVPSVAKYAHTCHVYYTCGIHNISACL